ncbi:CRISPR-associated protein Cas5 [Bifidobacterium angulatum]
MRAATKRANWRTPVAWQTRPTSPVPPFSTSSVVTLPPKPPQASWTR